MSISVLKWSLEEARNMAYFQLCLPPVYADNSQAAVTVIAEILAGSLQMEVCLTASKVPNAELTARQHYMNLQLCLRGGVSSCQGSNTWSHVSMFTIWTSLKTQHKNIYCGLQIFSVFFLSSLLLSASSSLTYLKHLPEKVSAQLLFSPEQTENMPVWLQILTRVSLLTYYWSEDRCVFYVWFQP